MLNDPSKMLDWSNYLYGFAAFLTLVGTFGVIYFGRVASQLKDAQVKQYQKEADLKIANANESAAQAYRKGNEAYQKGEEAQASASGANAIAATAHAEAEKAKADAAVARAEAEKSKAERAKYEARLQGANTDAEVARRDAANARLETERVRLDLATMQQRFADRVLTEQQVKDISASLHQFAGQEFQFSAATTSEEVVAFTKQVDQILLAANWKHIPETRRLIGTFVGMYVLVSSDPDPKTVGVAVKLIDAFDKAGLAFKLARAPNEPRRNLLILQIGTKF